MNNFYFIELAKMGFNTFTCIGTVQCDIPLFKGKVSSVYAIPGVVSHVGVVYPDGYSVVWPIRWLKSFPAGSVKIPKAKITKKELVRRALRIGVKSSIARSRLES